MPYPGLLGACKVLVIEDHHAEREVLKNLLGRLYKNVEFFDATPITPELVLSRRPDVVLITSIAPEINRFMLCRQLKRIQAGIPVLLASAAGAPLDPASCYQAGGDDYLSKPFIEQEIVEKVRFHLELRLAYAHIARLKEQIQKQSACQTGLEQELAQAWDNIENLVQDRTFALTELNKNLKAEISERKKVERELEEQRAYLRQIIDTIPYSIFARDRDGRFKLANKTTANIFRTTVNELVGKKYSDVNPDATKVARFHQQDLDVMDKLEELRIPEEHYYFSLIGEARWLQITKRPIITANGKSDQVLSVMADITERKEAELALQQSEEHFRLVFEEGPLGMYLAGEDGRLLKANKSFYNLLGYQEDEIGVVSLWELTHPDDICEDRELFEQLFKAEKQKYDLEKRLLSKQGQAVWTHQTATLIQTHDEKPPYVLGMIEDITERKKAAEALTKYQQSLETQVRERTCELTQRNLELEIEILERKKAENSEREQRTLAEALGDTAALFNSTLEIDRVLDLILANIERVVPHDAAQVIFINSGGIEIVRQKGISHQTGGSLYPQHFSVAELNDLRLMLSTHEPYAIPSVGQEPTWKRTDGLEWVQSYAGAPVIADDKIIGFLCLFSKQNYFFDNSHAEHLKAFADHASIAIRNARAYEQEHELAAMQERQRLAREMHDAVSQNLFCASLMAETFPLLWKRNPQRALQSLNDLQRLTRGALAEMRNLLVELRPQALVNADFGDLLHQLAAGLAGRTKITPHISAPNPCKLPEDVQIVFFRIAQEAFNNIAKHSQASSVTINLTQKKEKIILKIQDNGRGFSFDRVPADCFGLKIMRERAASINARLKIHSQITKGSTIQLEWTKCPPEKG